MDNFDLLSIGDATLDAFLTPIESEAHCELKDKECLICFKYGDKIPVSNMEFSIGGNAANNSVGARRLGIKSAIVTTLGGDTTGNQILEKLGGEGVDITYAIQQPKAGSNYSTILNYGGERTIFSYHAPRSYEFPVELPSTPWVYLTSMGETFMPFYNHFVDWKKKHPEVKLAFNPGSRQLRAGFDAIKEALSLTDIIYVNKEEAKTITGVGEVDIKELLMKLSATGPKTSIITAGPEGSYAYDGKNFFKAGILPIDSYERTGAGDAFGSACIAALVKGMSIKEALLWGTVNSASVIGYVGAQRGLLSTEDMPHWLDRAESSGVEVGEF